ncbi:hypothetical protein ACFFHK_07035, partial [Gallibacterium trehalosifermentans]
KWLTPFVPYISALKDGVLRHESDKILKGSLVSCPNGEKIFRQKTSNFSEFYEEKYQFFAARKILTE